MTAAVEFRDASDTTRATAPVDFRVERYSKTAKGGPKTAVIRASGGKDDLIKLLEWIGYRAFISGGDGGRWHGIIERVEVRVGSAAYVVDLNEMYNYIAVGYTLAAVGATSTGARGITAWVGNDESIARFGRRELLETMGNTTAIHAAAARDNLLERKKYPRATVKLEPGSAASEPSAVIYCTGMWSLVDWKYCNVATSQAFAYSTIGSVVQAVGRDHDDDELNVVSLGQSFTSGPEEWNVQEIEIYAAIVGTPTNSLSVAIAENDGGEPGANLASATLTAAAFLSTPGWVRATFSSAYLLAAGTQYFLTISAAVEDEDNYYAFLLDEGQGYPDGSLLKKIGSTWSTVAADMPMRLYTNELIDNSVQIKSMLTQFGQFFGRVRVEVSSGILTESYRNGNYDALQEVEQLMDTGTINTRRMLADVSEDMTVRVYEEPDKSLRYSLHTDGHFYAGEYLIADEICPAGFWAEPGDIIPAGLDTSRMSGLDIFFVETSEYNVIEDKLTFEPFGEPNIYDLGVQHG